MVLLEVTDDAWAAVLAISAAIGQTPQEFVDDALVSHIDLGSDGTALVDGAAPIPSDHARGAALRPTVQVRRA